MNEIDRNVSEAAKQILIISLDRAFEVGENYIDTTHLLFACFLDEQIRSWLEGTNIPVDKKEGIMAFDIPRHYDGLHLGKTGRLDMAIKAIYRKLELPPRYIYPIHILSAITEVDPYRMEQILEGEGFTMVNLEEQIRAEEARIALGQRPRSS